MRYVVTRIETRPNHTDAAVLDTKTGETALFFDFLVYTVAEELNRGIGTRRDDYLWREAGFWAAQVEAELAERN